MSCSLSFIISHCVCVLYALYAQSGQLVTDVLLWETWGIFMQHRHLLWRTAAVFSTHTPTHTHTHIWRNHMGLYTICPLSVAQLPREYMINSFLVLSHAVEEQSHSSVILGVICWHNFNVNKKIFIFPNCAVWQTSEFGHCIDKCRDKL